MSLLHRLQLLLAAALLTLTAGSWLLHVYHSRDLYHQQLQLAAQVQAVILANSVAGSLQQEDWENVWRQLSHAAGDAELQLTIPGQASRRYGQASDSAVPIWFSRLYPLTPGTAVVQLQDGRGQSAELRVTHHAQQALAALWHKGWHFAGIALLLLVWLLLAASWWLRGQLRPLQSLALMAKRLSRQEPTLALPLPPTRELRELTIAFNRMADAVHHRVENLQQSINLWRQAAFADEETGLPNRRAMLDELSQRLGDPQGEHGMLLAIRLNRRGLHQAHGFGAVTRIWQSLLADLPQLTHQLRHYRYRTRDEELLLLLPHAAEGQVIQLAERCQQWLMNHDDDSLNDGLGWIGVSLYASGDAQSQVLAELDLALDQALAKGRNCWELHGGQRRLPLALLNIEERKQLVASVISKRLFAFSQQPVLQLANRSLLYHEWFPQFRDTHGHGVASRTLLAIARQCDQLPPLEQALVEEAATLIRNHSPRPTLALNLDPLSLLHSALPSRLAHLCDLDPELAHHLLLELDERRLVGNGPQLAERLKELRQRGLRLVVDHFGAEHASVTLLTCLRPSYIKLDGRLIRALPQQPDNLLFLQALLPVCQRLGCAVIATQVENEGDLRALTQAGVLFAQGYVLGQPQPFATTLHRLG